MIIGISVLTVLLAGLNVWLAWRTFQAQKSNETLLKETKQVLAETKDLQDRLFNDMNDALQQMTAFQEMMNTRERQTKQERARMAVQILLTALQHQVNVLHDQWIPSPNGLTLTDDPLGPVRVYQSELSWIPPCEWRDMCQKAFMSIGPIEHGQGDRARYDQLSALTGTVTRLKPGRNTGLYENCLQAIEDMV